MMPERAETAKSLLQEIKDLKEEVKNSRGQIFWMKVGGVLGSLLLLGVGWNTIEARAAADKANDASKETKQAQVISCHNANETRSRQTLLWDFVIDVSSADDGPRERAALAEIRIFIHDLFAQRDCSDLTKEYPAPEPPKITLN
jgi:hypothetical protein